MVAGFLLLAGCTGRWIELFNGESLDGWYCDPPERSGDWTVKDGMLLGENPDLQGSLLWTEETFRDFEVELEYKALCDDYDSGLFLRGLSQQAQIGISRSLGQDMTACIYAPEDDRGKYPGRTDKVLQVHRPGEWNKLKVEVRGRLIRTFLNGEPMVEYEAAVIPDQGPVGVQIHGGVHMAIQFRNIRLSEL